MSIHEPLELEYWFVNVFSGNMDIFTFIGVLMVTGMAAYFKMSSVTFGIFIAMFAVLLKSMGYDTLLIILILIFAPILFWWTRRVVE